MFQTTMTVKRKGVIVDQGVAMKVYAVSPQVIADNGGRSPYDSFKLYSLEGVPDIQRQDLLIDENSSVQYRVFGGVHRYEDDYLACLIEQILTT